MSTPATSDTALTPEASAAIAAENQAVREAQIDASLDGQDAPVVIPPPPADEPTAIAPERKLSIREQIAENAKLARAARESDAPLDQITRNDMGAEVPPFLVEKPAEEPAATEPEIPAEPSTDEPAEKPYTLKVRGEDISVASRRELLKLAEVDDSEADLFTDAALVRLAQKQIAASSFLSEAKGQAKEARHAPRPTGDTLPATVPTPAPAPDQGEAYTDVVESIMFGADPEEAARKLAEFVRAEAAKVASSTLAETNLATAKASIQDEIAEAARTFETSATDIAQDRHLGPAFYNGFVVDEVRADLLAAGLRPENVDAVLRGNIQDAMKTYIDVKNDGRVKLRSPAEIIAAAEVAARDKFRLPKAGSVPTPAPAPSPAPTVPAAQSRLDMKRGLAPQPSRSSVPTAGAPRQGDNPAARKNVVLEMRKARGQAA